MNTSLAGRSGRFRPLNATRLMALFAEIEQSGSRSSAFWQRFWCDMDRLSDDELRRLLMAVGMRGKPVLEALGTVVDRP